MAAQHVQSRQTTGSGTSLGLAYLSNNAAGNLLVSNAGNDGGIVNTIDDPTNVWATTRKQNETPAAMWQGSSHVPNCAAGSNTVTATFAGSAAFSSIAIAEYSGIETSAVERDFAVSALLVPDGTSHTSGAATAVAGDLMIGYGETYAGRSKTPGTDWTERADATNIRGIHLQERIAPSSGDFAASISWSSPTSAFVQIVIYKTAAAAGNPYPYYQQQMSG